MTKVIKIGKKNKFVNSNPIEFTYALVKNEENILSVVAEDNDDTKPTEYAFIELICKKYVDDLDLMYARNDKSRDGVLYIGHFNDGVV